jgi:hypothetical protein
MDVVMAAVLAFLGSQRTCLGAFGILTLFPSSDRSVGLPSARVAVARSGTNIVAGVCFVLGAVAVAADAFNFGTALVFAAAVLLAIKGIAEFLVRGRTTVRG